MSKLPLDPAAPSVPDRADAPVHPQSEEQHDAGQMEAKQADIGFMKGAHALVYDGDDAFMRKTGEAAVSAAPGMISTLKQGAGQVLGRLSPVARTMLKPELDEKVGLMSADIEARARQEAEKHRLQLSEQRQALATDAAVRHLDGDPKALTAHLDIAKSELVRRLEDEGADEAGVQAGVRGLVSHVVGRSVASRLGSDPFAAQRLFDEHRERMEPEAAAALAPHVAAAVDEAKGRQIAKAVIAEHAPKTAPVAASVQPVDAAPVLDGEALAAKAAERAADEPVVASAAASRVMAEAARQNAARMKAIRQTVTLAQDHLERPDVTSIDDLPGQLRLTLPASTRQAITEHYAQGGFPEISDDVSHGQAYLALARDPQGFLDADLTGQSTALNRADFQSLRQAQSALRQGGPAAQALRGQLGQIDATLSERVLDLGVDPESQPEVYAAMFSGAKRAVDQAQAANGGKPLTWEEVAKASDGQAPPKKSPGSPGRPAVTRGLTATERRTQPKPVAPPEYGYSTHEPPDAAALLENPEVLKWEEDAWRRSNPDAPRAEDRQEVGFWVFRNNSTGELIMEDRGPAIRKEDGLKRAAKGNPPFKPGFTLVLDFHTHPFDYVDDSHHPKPHNDFGEEVAGVSGPDRVDQTTLSKEEEAWGPGRPADYSTPYLASSNRTKENTTMAPALIGRASETPRIQPLLRDVANKSRTCVATLIDADRRHCFPALHFGGCRACEGASHIRGDGVPGGPCADRDTRRTAVAASGRF